MIWAWVGKYWKPLCIAAVLLVVGAQAYDSGYGRADAKWQAKWSERDAADANARAAAELTQRTEEQRRADWAAGVQRDATQALEQARTNADNANAATGRLRDELAKLQTRLGGARQGAGAAVSSASATRAAMVLSDLYGSCQSRLTEVSAAFDRSRIAGLACEKSYQGMKR